MQALELSTFTLGRELRDRRESLGYSQQALAESIGTSRKFIVELEAGKEHVSLALTLRALAALGFEGPALRTAAVPTTRFQKAFETTLSEGDYEFALRLLGEYATASLEAGRALMATAPKIRDKEYTTALGAITRWLSHKTQTPIPGWAHRIKPSANPVFLAEKLHPVGNRMKELIRRETPPEMAELNVWIRDRDLATL
ncbi:helix-turn-helix domain-containing protein [Paeniglutamicibacter sp. NPDC091659]|uniref:helix-turn-helix domain-containing protein n=1 Tax=Paeniglutamicibacter sp. NPDC091659 TaxID=3364389 RepID=UPI00381C313C